MRAAFEFRHVSWFDEEIYTRLRARNLALCVADSEKLSTPVVMTADYGYFRLRDEGYTPADIERWAGVIGEKAQGCADDLRLLQARRVRQRPRVREAAARCAFQLEPRPRTPNAEPNLPPPARALPRHAIASPQAGTRTKKLEPRSVNDVFVVRSPRSHPPRAFIQISSSAPGCSSLVIQTIWPRCTALW